MNSTEKAITAKLIPGHVGKFNVNHRKEGKSFFSSILVVSLAEKPWGDGRINPAISLRLYGTGTKNYACLWAGERRGSGSAGGYGYHRPSAAAGEAFTNAGFALSKAIGGVGESAIREALLAVAKCLKVKRPAIVEAHP